MHQFYAVYSEAHEIVPQFIIRFQNLRRLLAHQHPKDYVKETFLLALIELLRTTLLVLDYKDPLVEQVIDKALLMDKTQASDSKLMVLLQKSLPTPEDCSFSKQSNTLPV